MKRARTVLPLVLLLLLLFAGGAGVALVAGVVDLRSGSVSEDAERAGGAAADGAGSEGATRDGTRPDGRSRARVGATPARGVVEHDVEEVGEGDAGGEQSPASPQPPAVPGEDPGEPTTVRGRVVDASTGEPLVGARVLVARRDHGWHGSRAGPDGAFAGTVPEADDDAAPVEVRIGRRGYRTLVVPWSGGPVEARLQPRSTPPQPGVVEGLATDPGGRPVSGRILLTTYDEMGDHHGVWALADEAGAFRLEGLQPGWWRVRLVGGSGWRDVVLTDGGTARVHVVAGAEPWPGTLTEEEFEELHRRLRETVPPGTTDERLSEEEREYARLRHLLAVQDLESRWRGARPARPVVVRGLPDDDPAWLRADSTFGPNHSWRVRVEGGEARFPALTPERWALFLEVPGKEPIQSSLQVHEGDEPLLVDW